MNEILTEYAGKALAWLESGAAWIAGKIPVYVEEVLRWKCAEGVAYAVLGAVFAIAGVIALILGIKYIIESDGVSIIAAVIGGVCAPISFSVMFDNIMNVIKISIAPRVYMIEYLTDMLN